MATRSSTSSGSLMATFSFPITVIEMGIRRGMKFFGYKTAEDFIILHKWVIAYLDSKGDIYPDLPVGLSSREWRNLLSNEGLLWKATSRNHLEIIKLLLESLSSEEVIQLSATDQAIFLAIEIAIICNRHEILRYILNHVRAAGVSTLSTFLTSDTTLEDIGSFAGCDEQVVECILDSLETPEEKFKLLTSSSLSGSDYSVMPDNIQTAELMLKHLNNDQLYQYVKSRCHKLDYVVANLYLESTFHFDEPDIVKLLMDALTAEQRLCILRLSENSLFCEDEGYKSPLGSMRTASLAEIAEAVSTDDEASEMIGSLDLSSEEFKELSTLSKKYYIIPKKAGALQQHAFIFYNSQDREGAHHEADVFENTFTNIGFNISRNEWKDAREFDDIIIVSLRSIADKCSVVVICIMAHGKAGMITGENGTQLPINDILHQCTQVLPKDIPLVMIIQACQSIKIESEGSQPGLDASKANIPNPLDASKASPEDNDHIDLVRPHTLLVHATVMKGVAVRGALANALNQEFLEARGNAEMSATTTAAFGRLPSMQIPILQSTLTKRLIFTKV